MLTQDLLANNLIGHGVDNLRLSAQSEKAFAPLLDVAWPVDISYGLNLQWPGSTNIVLKESDFYLVSFHTEQMDCDWLRHLSLQHANSEIHVLYDGDVASSTYWPDNVQFHKYVTWGQQLSNIVDCWGYPTVAEIRTHKISSLCHRQTQFKTYVTSLLLQLQASHHSMISWHDTRDYTVDHHVWTGTGRQRLDHLAQYMQNHEPVMVDDWYDLSYNYPMQNSDWNHPAYVRCAFNCTNESFHYSFTCRAGHEMIFPGPYLTEKTWKPLLAGTGLFVVGQYQTYRYLRDVGFEFTYPIDLGYDEVPGDLDRIEQCLGTLEKLLEFSEDDLVSMTRSSADHNREHILSGALSGQCEIINNRSMKKLAQLCG
jgi:hypothetical protein